MTDQSVLSRVSGKNREDGRRLACDGMPGLLKFGQTLG
jgi:hypothetical protein